MPASSIDPGRRDGAIRVDSETDGIIAVCLEGDFDLANAPVLRDHIDSALETGNDLIVDLSEATFIDSSIIYVLFDGAKAVDGRNQTVVLQVATAPVVERALELVAIESVVPRAHNRTEAVQMIQQMAALSLGHLVERHSARSHTATDHPRTCEDRDPSGRVNPRGVRGSAA